MGTSPSSARSRSTEWILRHAAENAAAADPNAPIPVPSVAALPAEPEVRRAEPAKPNDAPLDGQMIPVPVPAPINF